MADIAGIAILTMICGSAAVGVGRKVVERQRARKALRKRPALGASSPEGAVVRVTGTVKLADVPALAAPLSGKPCVVFRSRVRPGKGGWFWLAVRPEEWIEMVPFTIDRGPEGEVRIEGVHVLLDLDTQSVHRRTIPKHRTDLLMAQLGVPQHEYSRAHFDETIVEVGQRVSVAGLMMKDLVDAPPTDERGFRDEVPTTLRLAGDVDHPLVIGMPID